MAKKYHGIKLMKESMGVGIGSMAGMGAMGAIGGPGSTMMPTIGAGMNLINVGQMSKNAMGIVGMFGETKRRKRK